MMDTQPLLRVSSVKPQNKQPAMAPDSDGKQFDHHLQDQLQRSEAPEQSTNNRVNAAKSAETPVTQTADTEPNETEESVATGDVTEVAAIADDAPVVTEEAAIITHLLALDKDTMEQVLPQDGNILPPAIADIVLPQQTSPEAQLASVVTTQMVTKHTDSVMPDKMGVVAAPADAVDLVLTTKNESATQTLQPVTADDIPTRTVVAPDVKLQIKSDEVMSDKQFAALIAEANKNTTLSMQQVQAVTGNTAANIQSYVPPQFTVASATTTPGFNGSINLPVNHPAWGNQLGDQLVFMLQGKIQSAEIKLNPAHLGPMEIRLSVHEDNKASVTFISTHAPVREALDAALPRLRDMMEQQGLNLVNVDVSAHSGGQREAFDQQNQPSHASAFDHQHNDTAEPATVIRTQIESGLSVFV